MFHLPFEGNLFIHNITFYSAHDSIQTLTYMPQFDQESNLKIVRFLAILISKILMGQFLGEHNQKILWKMTKTKEWGMVWTNTSYWLLL